MPDAWPREKADSVGVPAMHVDARIVDDERDLVEQGEVGELELRGPHAAAGYWHAPEESAETFDVPAVDDPTTVSERSGWVSTGDLACRDADGYYYIEGRKKNMFVSGGENVYPPEVEDALADHPAVDEVVVIGVPDETWGRSGRPSCRATSRSRSTTSTRSWRVASRASNTHTTWRSSTRCPPAAPRR